MMGTTVAETRISLSPIPLYELNDSSKESN